MNIGKRVKLSNLYSKGHDMCKNINELVERLTKADEQDLDFSKVAWTEKHKIITLKEQSRVLVESLKILEGDDLEEAAKTAEKFLIDIQPIVSYIHRDKGGKQ